MTFAALAWTRMQSASEARAIASATGIDARWTLTTAPACWGHASGIMGNGAAATIAWSAAKREALRYESLPLVLVTSLTPLQTRDMR